jgi:hypothetical protein
MRKIEQYFMLKTLKPGGGGMKPHRAPRCSVKIMKTICFMLL